MREDRSEVLDADDYMEFFWDRKVVEFFRINGDGSVKWLLQYSLYLC